MRGSQLRLVDRSAEMQVVTEALDRLRDHREGATLEVAGGPGIGKSHLLRAVGLAAESRGFQVFIGRAAEFESELPFGVFNDALEPWLLGLEAPRLKSLAGTLAEDLATVLPIFEQVARRRAPQLPEERFRAYRAVREVLTAIAHEVPAVLILDDIHWADPGSVELLSHLLAHPSRGAVVVVVAFRPGQLPPLLATVLDRPMHEEAGSRIDLRPLSESGARRLLGSTVSGPTLDRLYRESGGNPFFLLQLARAEKLERDASARTVRGPSSVPDPVAHAIARELASLSTAARSLLEAAAATGDPFEYQLAALTSGLSGDDADDALDELSRFQLVLPAAAPHSFSFRHPIVRATVSELTPRRCQSAAHARLASALAARGASAAVQAPHLEYSANQGNEAAIATLVAAGRDSAPRAPGLAARWFRTALRLLPEGPDSEPQRVQLLVALATALAGAGQLEASRDVLGQLLGRLAHGHPARIPVVAFCAGVEHLLGRHRAADARLTEALGQLADGQSAEAVQLKLELAAGHGYQNRAEEMLAAAEEALAGATALREPALAVAALGQIALARYFLGLPAGDAIEQAAAAMDALDDAALAGRLDLGLWIGWSEAVLERHERSIEHCLRVIEVAHATGQGAPLLVTRTAQAWSLIRLGRLAEAEEVLSAVIEAGRLAPNLFLSVAVGQAALVATCKGDFDAALNMGEESVRLARRADPGLIPGMSGVYHAIPLLEAGQPKRAREVLLAMSGGDPGLRTSRSGWAQAYEILVRSELALGNIEGAEAWAGRAEALPAAGELAAETAIIRRASAAVELARGRSLRAADLAFDGAQRADDSGSPLEAGRCRILGAQALLEAHHVGRARHELEQTARDLRRIGADHYLCVATGQLGEVSGGYVVPDERDLPQGAWDTLTPTERAIVDLVAQGLTNPEVAARLFVSRSTVKHHLARVMDKTGLDSRVKLAREASRRGQ